MKILLFSCQIWMCGGKMANMPCSRVGHVYRRNVPYTYYKANAVLVNFRRVAEVWMDQYKDWLYERRPEIKRVADYGDISDRVALRHKLKCRSFEWYMKNVLNDTVRQNYEPLRGSGLVGLSFSTFSSSRTGFLYFRYFYSMTRKTINCVFTVISLSNTLVHYCVVYFCGYLVNRFAIQGPTCALILKVEHLVI